MFRFSSWILFFYGKTYSVHGQYNMILGFNGFSKLKKTKNPENYFISYIRKIITNARSIHCSMVPSTFVSPIPNDILINKM